MDFENLTLEEFRKLSAEEFEKIPKDIYDRLIEEEMNTFSKYTYDLDRIIWDD